MHRLILYDPDTLYAVIGYYNQAIFPAQVVALLLALAALAYALWPRRGSGRVIAAILGAGWLFAGIAFLGDHYASINWAGTYYEIAFAVQGALLLGYGTLRGGLDLRFDGGVSAWAGLGLAVVAIVVHPLIERAVGRGWTEAQYVGVTPDPTCLLTLALLLMSVRRVPWWLLVIPALWAVIGGGWSWLLGTPERMILPVLSLVAIALILWGNRAEAGRLSRVQASASRATGRSAIGQCSAAEPTPSATHSHHMTS